MATVEQLAAGKLLLDRPAEAVARLTLNNPEKRNALDHDVLDAIAATLPELDRGIDIRCVVITGAGEKAFSAGADIHEMAVLSPDELAERQRRRATFTWHLATLKKPTIGAINGLAYGGGCELALVCDLRIMAEDATIGVPEILIGVLPGAGGTQRLAHMLPAAIAKQMIYFGEPLSSEEALRHGLVNRVVPREQVLDTAFEWARRLATRPPLALRSAKLLVHTGINADLKTGIEAERQAVAFLFGTADREEGMRAFLEKRTATFRGR